MLLSQKHLQHWKNIVNKIIIFLISFSLLLFAQDKKDTYQLGQGLQIASLPIYLGGYFSLEYNHKNDVTVFNVDDIAFLNYGNYGKFSYMVEFEIKELYVKTKVANRTFVHKNRRINTERLYFDYTFNENYIIRVGKFSSPIGYWNLVPVNVLRDTSSHPITSDILFPQFTTGTSLKYRSYNIGEFTLDLTLQNNTDIDYNYNNYKIDKHYGVGVTYTKDDFSCKFNSGLFEKTPDYFKSEELYYMLLALKYDNNDFKILSEIGSQKSKNEFTTKYAGYVQGLYRFNEKNNFILRAESFKTNLTPKAEHVGILGYNYRPIYPVSIKAEYQLHSTSRDNELLLSFSMMF